MDATGQIFQLIPQIAKAIGVVGKTRKNQQQNYSFRGIDDLYAAVQGPLMDHGVFVVPEVLDERREERQNKSGGLLLYAVIKVRHTFYAPDGSNIAAVTIGEAMDSGDKASNKAMSAAMKYALIEMFYIPTEGDNDTENQTHEVKPKAEAKPAAKSIIDASVPMSEREKRQVCMEELFDAHGFTDAACREVQRAVCAKKKITHVTLLPQEEWLTFMATVNDGKWNAQTGKMVPREKATA